MAILNEPVRNSLILIALALGARLLVFGAAVSDTGVGLKEYAAIHDGREYQRFAMSLGSVEEMRNLAERNQRLFPGYPAMIRLMTPVASPPAGALAVTLLSALAATLLFYHLSGDVWLAAYFAVFTPSWLLYSSVAMSEALFVAVALWGFALWRDGKAALSGIVFGALTLVRPVGVFVFAACWLVQLMGPKRKYCAPMLALYLIAPLGWLALAGMVWGEPFRQVNEYVEGDYARPFLAIFRSLFSGGDLLKQALTWFTLLTNLAALVVLARDFLESRKDETLALILWLGMMTLFFLSLPSSWAYACLDRFFLACLPPMMIGLGWAFPRVWWGVAIVAGGGLVICARWNWNMLNALGL